jgi:4-alpha-glucanotransferase
MRVLQFGFGGDAERNPHHPGNHVRRCAVYPGTHDNDTALGWYRDRGGPGSARSPRQARAERAAARAALGRNAAEPAWGLVRLAFASPADTAIAPMQDLLGLGSSARMNRPGEPRGNWEWRFGEESLTRRLAARIRKLVASTGRLRGRGRRP